MGTANARTRIAAAALFAAGVSRAEAAHRLGVSRATASRWFRIWRAGGARALAARPPRGRPPSLAAADLAAIHPCLERPPRELGFALDRWSLAAVAALIERRRGVTYHRRHIGRVLRRTGWVVLPLGEHAAHAFRQLEQRDPDGNPLLLRRAAAGLPDR
jgi:transposase